MLPGIYLLRRQQEMAGPLDSRKHVEIPCVGDIEAARFVYLPMPQFISL